MNDVNINITIIKTSDSFECKVLRNLLFDHDPQVLLNHLKDIRIDRFPNYLLSCIKKYFLKDGLVYSHYSQVLFDYFVNIVEYYTEYCRVLHDFKNIQDILIYQNEYQEYRLDEYKRRYPCLLNKRIETIRDYDKYYEIITEMFIDSINCNSLFFRDLFFRKLKEEYEKNQSREDKRETGFTGY